MKADNTFLLLTGNFKRNRYNDKCYFELSKGKSIPCEKTILIADPTYDSTFKRLFGVNGSEKRLKSLLNALFFPDEKEEKILRLKYLTNEFHKIDKKNNKSLLRSDIDCEIETNHQKKLVIIEMQIANKGSLNRRLFNYGIALTYNNFDNSYKNCLSIGLSIDSNISSNYVQLVRKNERGETILEYLKMYEINIDDEYSKIRNMNDVKINNKNLKNEGKEFIKLLSVRNWAKKEKNRFVLPELNIYGKGTLNECIKILSAVNDNEISEMMLDKQYELDIIGENYKEGQKDGFDKGIKQGMIKSAFKFFLSGNSDGLIEFLVAQNLESTNGINENELRETLSNEHKILVEEFVNFLKLYEFLNNDN